MTLRFTPAFGFQDNSPETSPRAIQYRLIEVDKRLVTGEIRRGLNLSEGKFPQLPPYVPLSIHCDTVTQSPLLLVFRIDSSPTRARSAVGVSATVTQSDSACGGQINADCWQAKRQKQHVKSYHSNILVFTHLTSHKERNCKYSFFLYLCNNL